LVLRSAPNDSGGCAADGRAWVWGGGGPGGGRRGQAA